MLPVVLDLAGMSHREVRVPDVSARLSGAPGAAARLLARRYSDWRPVHPLNPVRPLGNVSS